MICGLCHAVGVPLLAYIVLNDKDKDLLHPLYSPLLYAPSYIMEQ